MNSFYPEKSALRSSWIHLVGPDARDFLQRVSTVNTKTLSPGRGARGCFLQANGKIRSTFTVWQTAEQEFGLEIIGDDANQTWKKALLQTLEQLTFSEKMECIDVEVLSNAWILVDGPDHSFGTATYETLAAPGGIRICNHGENEFGKTLLSIWGLKDSVIAWIADHFANASEIQEAELDGIRIQKLSPRLSLEITFDTTPLEAGIKNSVAENKGCYPGQEVIERIISQGSSPRRLCLIQTNQAVEKLPLVLHTQGTPPMEVGQMTSWHSNFGLAIVRKTHAKEGMELLEGKVIRVSEA